MNVLVSGPTGVGKSTLVNAVLRAPVAKTGRGTPVTEEITAWSVEGIPITVYDTPSLELDRKIKDTTKHIVKFVEKQLKGDTSGHIHVLWYCVNAQSNRFLDVEADFIKALSRLLPSIVVMTQCLGPEDEDAQDFARIARQLLEGHDADVSKSSPVRSLALPRRVGTVTYEPFGLTDLVATTYDMLPEAVKRDSRTRRG